MIDALLWREASIATDLDRFFAQVGGRLLEVLDATAIAVRVLERDHLDTIAMIRRGAVGVGRPARPRSVVTASVAARVKAWIEAGEIEKRSGSLVSRELLRGIGDSIEARWWLAPLAAHSEAIGALLVCSPQIDPRKLAAICAPLGAALATEQSRRELRQLREAAEAAKEAALARLHVRDLGVAVIGAETGLGEVMRQVEQVAQTSAPVLIFGETGSGKEVVARAIHERSARARGPVLRVNCGAIPPELVDSELFGHERGAFTGASARRQGWFERADGGTLFLDEVAELPLAAQVRLLRVLQDGAFERVGGVAPLIVDVRVVAATHRDLAAMVRAQQFREDLWYRINVFVIHLPPLRERRRDIAALAEHFIERVCRRFGTSLLAVSARDLALLENYDWPGNVRELSAVIERAAILGDGKRLDVARALGVASPVRMVAPSSTFPTLDEAMRTHIEAALTLTRGRIDGAHGAARRLAIHPNTLRSRMQRLGVDLTKFRD